MNAIKQGELIDDLWEKSVRFYLEKLGIQQKRKGRGKQQRAEEQRHWQPPKNFLMMFL